MLKLFSVDDHIVEPADVWTKRLPKKFMDKGPHVVEAEGRQFWVYEDQRSATMGLNAVAGKDPKDWGTDPVRFADLIPGCYDPAARADDFRADGIVGSVLFPSLPGFGGRVFFEMKDKELADLCVRAYNDFVIDEWCAAAPDIFVPTIITQLWDPELAAAEIRRCADRGARAVSFPENPSYLNQPSLHTDHWDPVFHAFEETGLVCSMHLGSSGHIPMPTPDSHFSIAITAAPAVVGIETITDLLFGTLPRRFPNVQFVLTEGGVGYIPYVLERADFVWNKHRYWAPFGDVQPSEIFHRQFAVCAVNEAFGLSQEAIDAIGIDNILWESDYPHSETTWPASQSEAAKVLGHLSPEQIDKITHRNAERIFRFPVTESGRATVNSPRPKNTYGNGERPPAIKATPVSANDGQRGPDVSDVVAGTATSG
ncbi:amidohydrolase family protein [Mycolicibacterium sp. XJ1819]